ncbi:MAG: DUF87 domain-containing protein [Bacilli bacterium]|nr:DUF87 domain-containing protein [Bacilli bacterium]
MFGKILSINDIDVIIENTSKKIESSLLGVHIIFDSGIEKIVGQINDMTLENIHVVLVGEIFNDHFEPGIVKKPNLNSTIRIIYKNEVPLLLGSQVKDEKNNLYIGSSLVYKDYIVSSKLNDFFSNHFAIIGNSGSGKSCGFARLMQNLFYRNINKPELSNIVIFDVYGEYNSSFQKINDIPGLKTKALTTRTRFSEGEVINIPPYLLRSDDLAILLGAEESNQIPIIEKALDLVYLFSEEENLVKDYKSQILAKALLDIVASGKQPVQIRDQIIAVLTKFNTADLNLESSIAQPGYVRTLKQCLNVDSTGKINAMQLVVEFLEPIANKQMEAFVSKKPVAYTLTDLYDAFEFALISEGILKSDKVFDKANILKIRLESIINSEYAKYFEVSDYIDEISFIKKLFTTPTGEKAQILNINLNYIDERFTKIITKLYSRIFFDFATRVENRAAFPIHIILEEAHRYVQNDNDINIIGYNIFDRITKEGRKYGVLLGLITQRPSELSHTSLSQCSNFLVFRMFHPDDIKIVSGISSNITDDTVKKLKSLRPGVALTFGTAFHLPSLVKFEMPDPAPQSTSANLEMTWYRK